MTKNETVDFIDGLHRLGFRSEREQIEALIQSAIKRRLGPVEFCEQLVAMEQRERDVRNMARRTRAAKLGSVTPLDQFDWNHPRKIDRRLFERLMALEFVQTGHNVLFRGPSGVGKTTLAKHLGLEALRLGHTVRFCTFAQALAELLKQESLPALERRLKRYTSPDLLILDEIGYLPCDPQAADVLFNIVTRRHESRSLVITTNLPFKRWGTLFSGAASVAALVDRFAQHCHTLDVEADSWRQKHSVASKNTKPSKERQTKSPKGEEPNQ